jgi:hypothetical protein
LCSGGRGEEIQPDEKARRAESATKKRTGAADTLSGAAVFNAGSMRWIRGLDDYRPDSFDRLPVHPEVQPMTRHVLDQFARSPESVLALGAPQP